MFFNALLIAAVAFWYFNAVWMPQSGSPEFATKQRRAALRAYGLSVTSPSDSNSAFTVGNPVQLNFDLASPKPDNSSIGFTLTKGTTTALNITSNVNCQNDTAGLSYTCQWFIPYSVNIGPGYSILISISNTAWVESTKTFAVTTRSPVTASSLMQSEITTIQTNLPADKTYVTADLEVHREVQSPRYNLLEAPIFSIAQGVNVTNGGLTYTWTVPVTLANTTEGYSIWIWAYTKAGDASTRTLVNVGSAAVVQPLSLSGKYPGQSVTVAFPGSGDMWRTGTNDSVSFDWKPSSTWYTGFNADVYATDPANPLYYNPLRVLVNGDSSKRSFTFPVPKTIQQGNYFIYVWGFQGASMGVPMGGKGGIFLTYGSVAPSSASSILAVSSPAANNVLYKGDQVNIQWSAGMALSTLDIFLDFVTNTSSTNKATIASNITANTNTWKWVIPTTTESHKFYSIRVQGSQSVAQGNGVFTGVSYPITIMNKGENAGSLDQGSSVNNDLAASSGTGTKKNGNGLNLGSGAQMLQTVSAAAGALLMLVTVMTTLF